MRRKSKLLDARTENADFVDFLRAELLKRCKKNPAYSLRAFSRALQVDDSTLAKIINGKRKLGKRALPRMAARLGCSPDQVAKFLGAQAVNGNSDQKAYTQLRRDTFEVISDWYHFAVLELIRVKNFRNDVRWISRTLGINPVEAQAAVDRLIRVGLLEVSKHGQWRDLSGVRATNISDDMNAAAFRILQRQILEKAIAAVETTPLKYRDQTAMTMAIDSRKLHEARNKIKNFRRSLAKFMSRGSSLDSVFNLSISLYPVNANHEGISK